MAGFRKRVRAPRRFSRSTRMRRTGRFKGRRSGGSRFTGSSNVRTGYDASNANITFRRKKTSLRSYRNNLLRTTQFLPHYRSVGAEVTPFVVSTPLAGSNSATVAAISALSGSTPFWLSTGGAQPVDNAGTVPIFSPSSIVIRGGKVKLTCTNRSTDETLRVRVWVVFAKANQTQVTIPTTVPIGWDPTMIPDFVQAYKMLFGREVLLLPGARPMEVEAKLKPQKIDFDTFLNEANGKLVWIVSVSETDDSDGSASLLGVTAHHSLSFSGDAT